MDILDRYQDELERRRERQALHGGSPHATRADEAQKVRHQVTIIGCIRGVDGWYRCGFDEARKAIVPLEKLEQDKSCTTAVRSAPLADKKTEGA